MKLIYMIKLKYVLTPTPLVYQKMRLSIRGEGGRREGILKLLVKVSLKFEVIWRFASYKSTKNVT